MTYISRDKKSRKWRTLFFLSLLLNIALIAILYFENKLKEPQFEEMVTAPSVPEQEVVEHTTPEQVPVQEKKPLKISDIIAVNITLEDNFYTAFSQNEDVRRYSETYTIPNLAKLLSAHVARVLMWDLALHKDVRKGDRISFLFRIISTEEAARRDDLPDLVEVIAVNYYSNKFSKTIEIYQFKPDTEKYNKYYYADGRMIERILNPSPIGDYIQVTALLHDSGRRHDGIDYKAPVGTPVYATTDGIVLRTNWKTKYNGYCIEIKAKGKENTYKYLHLSDVLVRKGDSVSVGDHIANSGNTGRSTAPHLHYQVQKGARGKVLDPVEYHETHVSELEGENLQSFTEQIFDYQKLLQPDGNDALSKQETASSELVSKP